MKHSAPLMPVLAALILLCGAAAWADPPSQVGRLSYMRGSVSFLSASVNDWAPAALNYPLTAGDQLWTDAGARAEVQVLSAAIRLNASTDFAFLNLDDQTVQVRLSTGALMIDRRPSDDAMDFEIDTPNATVTLPVAGVYRIDVNPNGDTAVTVRAGRAEVTAGPDAYDVTAGQSAAISGLDSISSTVTTAPREDEWEAWSADRDRQEQWVASSTYVSRDMIGVEDLNDNGSWVNDPEDGPVWVPTRVPAGWAPYRFGHWSWVSPWGWTWVDDASWGFAPFHYGRWRYWNARWVWIPGAPQARHVYAPALVVFVGGAGWTPAAGQGIGWFPLGPREIYVPPYAVSSPYIQRINIASVTTINTQVIERYDPDKVVYVNRSAPRAVTVVPRTVFVLSRPAAPAAISLSPAETTRAPLMGMTARVVPQSESITGRPAALRASVPQPPRAAVSRRVYARLVPAPAPVPFVQQQKVLAANPGRPIDPASLASLQKAGKAAPPNAVLVEPETLTRRTAPAAPAARAPVPAPAAPAPPVQKQVTRPVPQAQQRVAAPAPPVQRPTAQKPPVHKQVVQPVPKPQQKVTPPAPAAQQPKSTPRSPKKPVKKPLPPDDQIYLDQGQGG